jgi:hypothetical protein
LKNNLFDNQSFSVVLKSLEGSGFDEVLLEFGYPENEPGALKLFSKVVTAPSLFFPNSDKNLSVRYLTEPEKNPTVPLMFKPGHNGMYSISCNFKPANFKTVILEDRLRGYLQDLKSKAAYTFSAALNDIPERFVLHFGPSDENEKNPLPARIYTSDEFLVIDLALTSKPADLMVYDIPGRILLHQQLSGTTINKIELNSPPQLLIIHIRSEEGAKTQKILWGNK